MSELRCPHCASTDLVPIVYGLPGPDLFEQADRGEVALGGCCITDDAPDLRCTTCGHESRAL